MASVIDRLFAVPWEVLDKPQVETFLDTAGNEGLTWEVKGDAKSGRWPRREQIEKAVGAFANSQLGGVLLVGAERRDRRSPGWDLVGVGPPAESEPELALARVIRTGVDPVPPYRIRAWQLDGVRWSAAVWVEPTPEPPTITRDGIVYERVSGASEQVTDAARLARLFDQGDAARAGAENAAVDVALRAGVADQVARSVTEKWPNAADRDRFKLGLAATGNEGDIGRRLVRASFRSLLDQLGHELRTERGVPGFADRVVVEQGRGWVCTRVEPPGHDEYSRRWAIWATWSGAVGVACVGPAFPAHDAFREEVLTPAWAVAARVVVALGGLDRAHTAVFGDGPISGRTDWPTHAAPVRRWIDLPPPDAAPEYAVDDEDLVAVMDELRRHAGEQIWVHEA
jgi:Putative DNA-binding domain